MEFFDKALGFKKKRQEKVLKNLNLDNQRVDKERFTGPNWEKADTIEVESESFLSLVDSQKPTQINSTPRGRYNELTSYDVFFRIDEGLALKTSAIQLHYDKNKPEPKEQVFENLHKKGYRFDKEKSVQGEWIVYTK